MNEIQTNLNQAKHNESFLAQIGEDFYDWRVTTLFYIAVHYLRAFACYLETDAGSTHEEMESKAKQYPLHIKDWAWQHYKRLKNYSREARYDGFDDAFIFQEVQKDNYEKCLLHLDEFKKYLKNRGLPT